MLPKVFSQRSEYGTPVLAILCSASGILLFSSSNFIEVSPMCVASAEMPPFYSKPLTLAGPVHFQLPSTSFSSVVS